MNLLGHFTAAVETYSLTLISGPSPKSQIIFASRFAYRLPYLNELNPPKVPSITVL